MLFFEKSYYFWFVMDEASAICFNCQTELILDKSLFADNNDNKSNSHQSLSSQVRSLFFDFYISDLPSFHSSLRWDDTFHLDIDSYIWNCQKISCLKQVPRTQPIFYSIKFIVKIIVAWAFRQIDQYVQKKDLHHNRVISLILYAIQIPRLKDPCVRFKFQFFFYDFSYLLRRYAHTANQFVRLRG